jgi:hypothetical protein
MRIARALVQALWTVPGVADVDAGRLGERASYGRGSRVPVSGSGPKRRNSGSRCMVTADAPDLVVPVLAEVIRSRLRQHRHELSGNRDRCDRCRRRRPAA